MHSSAQSNDSFWLETLEAVSPEVGLFVSRFPDSSAADFQFKWDWFKSLLSRSLVGKLRHLPTGLSVGFTVRLPI